MAIKRDFLQTVHTINPFSNGSIFDHTGGNTYSPPPPPVPASNILQEDGYRLLTESGDYLALE